MSQYIFFFYAVYVYFTCSFTPVGAACDKRRFEILLLYLALLPLLKTSAAIYQIVQLYILALYYDKKN